MEFFGENVNFFFRFWFYVEKLSTPYLIKYQKKYFWILSIIIIVYHFETMPLKCHLYLEIKFSRKWRSVKEFLVVGVSPRRSSEISPIFDTCRSVDHVQNELLHLLKYVSD
jgi:hypothetical protein